MCKRGEKMSVLYKKLLKVYSLKELYSLFDKRTIERLNSESKSFLTTFSKKIDLDRINYTHLDFINDFPYMKKYKETEVIFKIYKNGMSLKEYSKTHGFNNDSFLNALKNGINYNKEFHIKYFQEFIPKFLEIEDFEVIIFNTHCEFYGEFEKLENFKTKNLIKQNVLLDKFKNEYHLAFNGHLFEIIKKISLNPI